MTQPTSMPPDDQNPSDFADSPGRQLRALRQSRGMEIERVAAQLHLERGVVELLEHDQFEDLPSPVFVAGYLRNYARLLGADPSPIIAAYRSTRPDYNAPTPITKASRRPARKPPARGGLPWPLIATVVLAVVAAGLIGLWWQGHSNSESGMTALRSGETGDLPLGSAQSQVEPSQEPGSTNPPAAPTADEPEEPEEPAPVDSFGSTAAVPPDAIPLRPLTAAATPGTSPSPSEDAENIPASGLPSGAAPEPEPTPEPKKQEVVLNFTGTSWVDVRDATGQVVLNGEMRDGDHRVLTGEPPYKLVIGNAAATQLLVGDRPFDLDKRAQGNVARFTLDPSKTND